MSSEREIYLDWNATTPIHPSVRERMISVASAAWANPSSLHAAGRQARVVVETCRERVAQLCAADPRDVILTSGGTEANNLALSGAVGLVTSRLEHPSIVRVAETLERTGCPVRWIPPSESGHASPEAIDMALAELPVGSTVTLTAVNHETGCIQAVRETAERVRRRGGRFHVDAVQAIGRAPSEVWLGADTLSIAAHKLRGPKGIGALVMRPGIALRPVLLGGAQERGLRPGTQDAVACAGFAAALEHVEDALLRYAALEPLRDMLEQALSGSAVRNGASPRVGHVSNLSFPGFRGDELVAALDLEGVYVSSGSACSAGSAEPSAVVLAMLGTERARSALRISLGEETTAKQIADAIQVFQSVLARPGASRSSTLE